MLPSLRVGLCLGLLLAGGVGGAHAADAGADGSRADAGALLEARGPGSDAGVDAGLARGVDGGGGGAEVGTAGVVEGAYAGGTPAASVAAPSAVREIPRAAAGVGAAGAAGASAGTASAAEASTGAEAAAAATAGASGAPGAVDDTGGVGEVTAAAETPGGLAGFLGLPGSWQSRGELGLEGRLFRDDELAATKDGGLGIVGRLELRHTHGAFDEKVRVYGRMDRYDEQRSTLAWEEAFVQVASERVRLRAGLDIVNWTATEAFHPADVINARNLDSDLENLEKIGEPMLALQVRPFEDTTVVALAMPYRTAPIFASSRSRLAFVPAVDLRGARLMVNRRGRLTDDDFGPQGALMIRQIIGPADLTVHALEHMDRTQPLVRVDPVALRPLLLFQTVQQLGGTYQHAIGALLVKLEGAYRHFRDPKEPLPGLAFDPATRQPLMIQAGQPDHGQLAVGFEWGTTHEGGAESTFLLEGQTLLGVSGEVERAALSVFQRDVLLGYRLAINDESSKELMAGAIFDTERAGEALFNLSYQQRIGETWTVRAGLRLFLAEETAPGFLGALRDADHVRLTVTRHF